ncbi:MerR family transcriptional regulator [Vibrio metschnikovii]|uniref:MerR family transcriptional regulator n=1 Tax=Vibrio metschnikovii TaxID=28172 RepID=UPI001C30309D|nr:MerR family transcriptional regulator [Vibrio metschnikovii]
MDYEAKHYAIREVAELTGVKPVTLRAWQRRYSLLQPLRTEKGHRLYTEQDIQTIQTIQSWLLKGVSIGKVSQLLHNNQLPESEVPDAGGELEACSTLLDALAKLKRAKAANVIATVMKEYPLDIIEAQFVLPVIEALEKVKGPLRSLQKGLFSSLMLSKLSSILESENKAAHRGPCLCISFDGHGSILAWLWAVMWAEKGYQVTFIEGVDDMSGLLQHESLHDWQGVSVFSHRSLAEAQRSALAQLKTQLQDHLVLSSVLDVLTHQENES